MDVTLSLCVCLTVTHTLSQQAWHIISHVAMQRVLLHSLTHCFSSPDLLPTLGVHACPVNKHTQEERETQAAVCWPPPPSTLFPFLFPSLPFCSGMEVMGGRRLQRQCVDERMNHRKEEEAVRPEIRRRDDGKSVERLHLRRLRCLFRCCCCCSFILFSLFPRISLRRRSCRPSIYRVCFRSPTLRRRQQQPRSWISAISRVRVCVHREKER